MPSYSKREVRALAEIRLLLLASQLRNYDVFRRKVKAIALGNASKEDKLASILKLTRIDRLASWWKKVALKDRHGRITAYTWPCPASQSDIMVHEALASVSLSSASENEGLRLRDLQELDD